MIFGTNAGYFMIKGLYGCQYNSTDALNSLLDPIKNEVKIKPFGKAKMEGEVELARFNKIGIFTIEGSPFTVTDRHRSYYGLTIPCSDPFMAQSRNRWKEYPLNYAHFLQPHEFFKFSSRERNFKVLVTNFYINSLKSIYEVLHRVSWPESACLNERINLYSNCGAMLKRDAYRLLDSAKNSASKEGSFVQMELEENMVYSLLNSVVVESGSPQYYDKENKRVSLAEEYIANNIDTPILREDLAKITNISIRSLSRSFRKIHGVGPMEFLRIRRLDRIYDELRYNRSNTKKVSQLAYKYGFYDLGTFAANYKIQFGELPSATLKKTKG